ncbi:MAG: hypothetical protein AAB479_00175 [Patescibacteria group bacterium]
MTTVNPHTHWAFVSSNGVSWLLFHGYVLWYKLKLMAELCETLAVDAQ